MIINFENGRAWHSDCKNHHGGIMKTISYDDEFGLMECLSCGKKGRYPVGGNGAFETDEIVEGKSCKK